VILEGPHKMVVWASSVVQASRAKWSRSQARQTIVRSSYSCEVQLELIDVAPTPVFTRLKRPHDRVITMVMEVLGCVLPNRGIATAYMSAFQAQAQVHPGLAYLQAFFATVGSTRRDIAD
jgi:hypothetical protein